MELSSELISQFAKVTNDDTPSNKEETVYGTAVAYDNDIYVQLDGSNLLTPINKTTEVQPGERVMVMIKNHTATVTGNISSPSARTDAVKDVGKEVSDIGSHISEFEIAIADKVSTKELETERGRINTLVSDNIIIKQSISANSANISELTTKTATISDELVAAEAKILKLTTDKLNVDVANANFATIDSLITVNGNIHNLQSTYGEFSRLTTDTLNVHDADISELKTYKLDVNAAALQYANIDFSNIGEAAIQNLFTDSGIIKNLVLSDGHITGELVGVTIKGDLIEGGTVKADKLVIKGSDGLFYKLNTDGVTTTSEQTEYNSLNGSVITAKSVTAEKVNVDDLVAFDATIGGFNITSNAIYSGVKDTINNATSGIYMDNEGQLSVGDETHYLRYYKDQNGVYRLEISAESIRFNANNTVGEAIESLTVGVNDTRDLATNTKNIAEDNADRLAQSESIIQQLTDSISMLIVDESGKSLMTQESDRWTFSMGQYDQTLNDISNDLNTLTASVGDTEHSVELLDQAVKDLGVMSDYVVVTTYNGQPCIELGERENDFKVRITNTEIQFAEGTTIPAYLSNQKLYIENAEVKGELQHGEFVWKIRSNGNLGLVWKGVTE